MVCCFLSLFKHVMQTGIFEPKIISSYLLMVSSIAFSSSFFIFIQLQRSIFNFFASSNRDALLIFITSFVTPGRLQKIILVLLLFLCLKKSIIIIAQHTALFVFCISVFTLFNICLRMIIFTLFVNRINL